MVDSIVFHPSRSGLTTNYSLKYMTELSPETTVQNPNLGTASLEPEELEILEWDNDRIVSEIQQVNPDVDSEVVKDKVLRIAEMCINNGGIAEAFRMSEPAVSWQSIRDLFMNDKPVKGMVSTHHNLGKINYPEGFWKAIIERERDKL